MTLIDVEKLNRQVDLLALAGSLTSLRRVASSGGGEWAGPCPFCGGEDRFRVQPHQPQGGIWLCRGCTDGKWQDAIAFGQRLWPSLPFPLVCELLAAGSPPLQSSSADHAAAGGSPLYAPPEQSWQAQAAQAVEVCGRLLWEPQGAAARAYLEQRGLHDEALHRWELGYSPGARFGELYLARGVLIPCRVAGEIWYLKIALLPGELVRCERCGKDAQARRPCPACGAVNKYRGVRGNRPAALYMADDLLGARLVLLVEGEFDALAAWQELRDVAAVCTLGSATNRPDLAVWGPYLMGVETLLAAYDADQAGERGAQVLQALSEKVRFCPPPEGYKDLNDYYQAGGDLWAWLKGHLLRLKIIQEGRGGFTA